MQLKYKIPPEPSHQHAEGCCPVQEAFYCDCVSHDVLMETSSQLNLASLYRRHMGLIRLMLSAVNYGIAWVICIVYIRTLFALSSTDSDL